MKKQSTEKYSEADKLISVCIVQNKTSVQQEVLYEPKYIS